jgi:hypothetical protein
MHRCGCICVSAGLLIVWSALTACLFWGLLCAFQGGCVGGWFLLPCILLYARPAARNWWQCAAVVYCDRGVNVGVSRTCAAAGEICTVTVNNTSVVCWGVLGGGALLLLAGSGTTHSLISTAALLDARWLRFSRYFLHDRSKICIMPPRSVSWLASRISYAADEICHDATCFLVCCCVTLVVWKDVGAGDWPWHMCVG